jgi:hypothetical protein
MSSNQRPRPTADPLAAGTDTYENVRVFIAPEGPYHYDVQLRLPDGSHAEHAVEFVALNTTQVEFEEPLWFVDVTLDVGVPIGQVGETAWIWP